MVLIVMVFGAVRREHPAIWIFFWNLKVTLQHGLGS